MEPVIANSAHRHGVADDDILHAYRNAMRVRLSDDDLRMLIGPDRAGTLIEVGLGADGRIVHAMRPARPKYLR